MARESTSSNTGRNVAILLLLLIAAGTIVAFQTDFVRWAFAKKAPSYSKELLAMISVNGSVKVKDLNLTGKEIKAVNFAAMKVSKVFPSVNVSLDMLDRFAPIKVENDTELKLGMVFKTEENCEVAFWTRTIPRKRLIPHMVRSMEEAMSEFENIRKLSRGEKTFKRLYL